MNLLQVTPGAPDIVPDSIPSPAEELKLLKSMPFDDLVNNVVNSIVHFAIDLVIALIVFYAGKFIIKKIYNLTLTILVRRKVDRSLSTFILSLIRMVLYFILIVTVIGIIGIETSSFLALFASAGVAIGMALSGTLQNFAGGVLILLLKPYKIGDYIEAQGFAGTVTEIQIFSTIICTPDNKSIIIPNGGLSTGSINNWSREEHRRVEWTVSLSYGDDVDTARKAILDMFKHDERIISGHGVDTTPAGAQADDQAPAESDIDTLAEAQEPAPRKSLWQRLFHHAKRHAPTDTDIWVETEKMKARALKRDIDRRPAVTVGSLAASSIDLTVRAWVRSADFWSVYYDYNERFYKELPAAGLSFPFPQLDVHVSSSSNNA